MLQPNDFFIGHWILLGIITMLVQEWIKGFVDQGGFAAATYSRYKDECCKGNVYINIF